jgi:16S rRNA U1498 N3-methylase RsmE
MQSRQVWLPQVVGPLTPSELVAASQVEVAMAEPGGGAVTLATPTVMIGPEGGWSPGELSVTAIHVGLGTSILRVETAAITVGALLCTQRGLHGDIDLR